jgi:hypothetical protein
LLHAWCGASRGWPVDVCFIQPEAVIAYLKDLDRLAEVVNRDLADGHSEAAAIIRSMVQTVTVMPTVRGRPPGLRVEGDLARLATFARPQMPSVVGGKAVPGVRLEAGRAHVSSPYAGVHR